MSTEVQDILKVNIVFVGVQLLKNPEKVKAFSDAIGTEAIVSETGLVLGLSPKGPEPGLRLSLHRERITIDNIGDRTVIEREYPDHDDLPRLTEVAGFALNHSDLVGQATTTYGYNIEMVYDQLSQTPSFQYLGERLFGKSDFNVGDWRFIGGAGWLAFDSEDGSWQIKLEPRFNDMETSKVFMSLNMHKAEQRVPSTADFQNDLGRVWNQAHDFVQCLDRRNL